MSKISALIKLIEDPDEQVFLQVRNEILSMGSEVIPDLEKALISLKSGDEPTERINEILNVIQGEILYQNLENWLKTEEQDLLELMILIEQIRDFDFPRQNIIEPIAQIKMEIWLELNENQTAFEQVKIVNRIFYSKHEFELDEQEPYAIQNQFIYNLLKNKKGNEITLGLLYLYLARSQNIPFLGIKLSSNEEIARRWLWFIQQAYIRKNNEQKMELLNKLLKLFVNV